MHFRYPEELRHSNQIRSSSVEADCIPPLIRNLSFFRWNIYVPASVLSHYKVAQNWTTYASHIIGHEDLEAGATLPNYTTSRFTKQTWYSDEKLTTVVTSVATSGTYYCRLEK